MSVNNSMEEDALPHIEGSISKKPDRGEGEEDRSEDRDKKMINKPNLEI